MPMWIVGEGMAVPEHKAAPPVAMTEATVARVVESRAEEAVPDEVAMAEAMMPDKAVMANKAVAMTPEAGMAEAMSTAAEVTTATAAEVAAAAATAMTRAELVDAGRQRLHRVHI
jgi:hypothetical protein